MLSYLDCLSEAAALPAVLTAFTEKTGLTLSTQMLNSPLVRDITEVSADEDPNAREAGEAFRHFALFVKDVVWAQLPTEFRRDACWVPSGNFAEIGVREPSQYSLFGECLG